MAGLVVRTDFLIRRLIDLVVIDGQFDMHAGLGSAQTPLLMGRGIDVDMNPRRAPRNANAAPNSAGHQVMQVFFMKDRFVDRHVLPLGSNLGIHLNLHALKGYCSATHLAWRSCCRVQTPLQPFGPQLWGSEQSRPPCFLHANRASHAAR